MTQPEDSKKENTDQSKEEPKGEDPNHSKKEGKKVPDEVETRLKTWLRIWRASIIIHYLFGIGGIVCSTMAAAQWPNVDYSRLFAIISGLCFAIIGFVRPEQRYLGFVRAWRKLSNAQVQYAYGLINLQTLLKLMESLENDATDLEFDATPLGKKS